MRASPGLPHLGVDEEDEDEDGEEADGPARDEEGPKGLAMGETIILQCHWLPFLRNSRTYLAVIAVIFCQNDRLSRG